MQSINIKLQAGVAWSTISWLLTRGANTAFLLALAYFVAPEAFALLAIATVFFEIAKIIVDSGLGVALIRSESVSATDLNTVFWYNLAIAVLLYVVIFACAPIVSQFYQQPALDHFLKLIGISAVIRSLKTVPVSILSRDMNFQLISKINILACIVAGGIAVASARIGVGFWSLAVQVIVNDLLSATLFLWVLKWRPHLVFSLGSLRKLMDFAGGLLVAEAINVVFQNFYVILIARVYAPEITGLYFFASKISLTVPQQLSGAFREATLPALAGLHHGVASVGKKARQIIQVLLAVVMPSMMLLAVFSTPLVSLMFAAQWHGAAEFVQILCLAGMLFPLASSMINILVAAGRSDVILRMEIFKKGSAMLLLLLALPYGPKYIALSQLGAGLVSTVANGLVVSKYSDYNLQEQLDDFLRPLVASGISALVAASVLSKSEEVSGLILCAALLFGLMVYIALGFIFKVRGIYYLRRIIVRKLALD